jgi:hypothetical protein
LGALVATAMAVGVATAMAVMVAMRTGAPVRTRHPARSLAIPPIRPPWLAPAT